jgi:hypothetical protein
MPAKLAMKRKEFDHTQPILHRLIPRKLRTRVVDVPHARIQPFVSLIENHDPATLTLTTMPPLTPFTATTRRQAQSKQLSEISTNKRTLLILTSFSLNARFTTTTTGHKIKKPVNIILLGKLC